MKEETQKKVDKIDIKHIQVIEQALSQYKEEVREALNEIYTEFENNYPPKEVIMLHEQSFNNGLYQGTLKAMETVVRKLTGKNGDVLQAKREFAQKQ